MRIVICDDDPICLENAKSAVEAWAEGCGQRVEISTFENGSDLIESLHQKKADILLLDIMMPMYNGMEVAKEIRTFDNNLILVFLTSSPEYAIESYDVIASGYLLKPLNFSKLSSVMNRCLRSIEQEPKQIVLRTAGGYRSVLVSSIECVEAQNKTMIITKTDGECLESTETLSNLEKMLTLEAGFFKCHRSYIVNLSAVEHFNTTEIITKSGCSIPIARGYGKAFKDAYFALMFQE